MKRARGKGAVLAAAALGIQLVGSFPVFAAPAGFSGSIPAEAAIADMEDPARSRWQQPEKVVAALNIGGKDTVADIGSGTGYFTIRMARKADHGGAVYAVDIDPELLSYLGKRAAREGVANVRSVLARPDDPLLPEGSVDLAFMCNTHLFIDHRVQYLAKVNKALKQGGRLAVISYNDSAEEGPPPQMRLSREQTIQEAEQAGFRLAGEYSFLPYQYFLIFRKR